MNVAQFLQTLQSSNQVDVVNDTYPELSGRRDVVKVQTNGFALRLPESHPRYTLDHQGSWTYLNRENGSRKMVGDTLVVHDFHGYHAEFTAVAK